MPLRSMPVHRTTAPSGMITLVSRSCATRATPKRASVVPRASRSARIITTRVETRARDRASAAGAFGRTTPPFLRCTNPFWDWKNCARGATSARGAERARQSSLGKTSRVVDRSASPRSDRGERRRGEDEGDEIDPKSFGAFGTRRTRGATRARAAARSVTHLLRLDDVVRHRDGPHARESAASDARGRGCDKR